MFLALAATDKRATMCQCPSREFGFGGSQERFSSEAQSTSASRRATITEQGTKSRLQPIVKHGR